MTTPESHRTSAELVDRAVDALLTTAEPASMPSPDAALRPAIEAAAVLRAVLVPVPASRRFEARLGARLAERGLVARGMRAIADLTRRELRQRGRLLVTGAAVSTAAVGVGVTALAMWRTSRRPAHYPHRLFHR